MSNETPPRTDGERQRFAQDALPGEARVLRAAHSSLAGEQRGLARIWPFLGPAFIAAVAYVDPGNFATNVAAGAKFGYLLLWVVLASNLMAMLIQSMSAKLGIATGQNLAEVARDRFPSWVRYSLWVQAELIAIATDLAEFIGASVALNLLFHVPLLVAAVITAIVAFGILALQAKGFRHLEAAIAGLVGLIVAGFAFEVLQSHVRWMAAGTGLITPRLDGSDSLLLAVGIIGATVMPHVIYLHSALTQNRVVVNDERLRRKLFRFELVDVVIAMTIAGLINMSMLLMAAGVFHPRGLAQNGDLDVVFRELGNVIGNHADIVFGIALLASGLSSSSVGTLSGQVVMQGFIRRSVPIWTRRVVTMAPAFAIIAFGVNPSRALVISQVVLSFGIPFALIPLIMFCANRKLMGTLVNRRLTTVAAIFVAAVIISLNVYLIWSTFT